jgi:leucyl-tRNA synthetase
MESGKTIESREQKWIRKWRESKVFEPIVNPDTKKFFLTVPYAYPTGPLHVGHGRTYVNGDVMARFHRIQGNNTWWPMGFHVTGTPVLAICDAIKRKDENTIALYREYLSIYEKDPKRIEELLKSFEDPKHVADYFAKHISEDLDGIGASIDWRSRFTTMDVEYQKFIQWQFRQLYAKKALVKGPYPILFSQADKNAVGEDDIKDGDTDKVAVQSFELVKFPYGKSFIVASTLRPETLFGVTNLWVNPNVDYVKAFVDGEEWIIAKNALEKLSQQAKHVQFIESIPSTSLQHQMVGHPLNASEKIPILFTSFVSAEKGTGIVYSVPGHAPWDFAALKELQTKGDEKATSIQVKYVITAPDLPKMEDWFTQQKNPSLAHKDTLQRMTEEVYKKEFYEGKMNFSNGLLSNMPVRQAKDRIVQQLQQHALHAQLYEPSRKAFTRSGNPVSVAVLGDQWFLDYSSPEWKKKTQGLLEKMHVHPPHFKKSISDALDWLDKRPCIRKRGLGTPFPYAEEWMIEPLSDSTLYPVFYVMIPHIRNARLQVTDLDDAFFNHAIMGNRLPSNDPRAKTADRIRKDLEYWYPNDLRHTAPAHISNHISFFLFAHTLILEEKFWPKSLTFNEMLVRNGVKMSKSKGNVIPLQHAIRDYGADLMRLFIVSSAGLERVADWKDNQVPQVKKKMEELELLFRSSIASINTQHSPETEWLVDTLRVRLGEAYASYVSMDFMGAAQKAFFETLNEVKRFKKVFGMDEAPAVKHVLNEWLVLLSPITPFLAEEMWELAHPARGADKYAIDPVQMKAYAGDTSFVSTQTMVKSPQGSPSPEMEERVLFIEGVLGDMERVKKMLKGKLPKAVYIYTSDPRDTEWVSVSQKQLSKYALVEIKINDAHDPLGKKQKAQKGRPALYFE